MKLVCKLPVKRFSSNEVFSYTQNSVLSLSCNTSKFMHDVILIRYLKKLSFCLLKVSISLKVLTIVLTRKRNMTLTSTDWSLLNKMIFDPSTTSQRLRTLFVTIQNANLLGRHFCFKILSSQFDP